MKYLIIPFLLFLSGCGYHLGRGEIVEKYHSICVPFVEGDTEGVLTNALISEITAQGYLAYRSNGSDLVLKVCLGEPQDENIGFNYASINERDAKVLVANEARLSTVATISLIERCSGRCLMGPIQIATSETFDFEPDLSTRSYHNFALGQLEMNNLARDAAFGPLYSQLAQKIVDYVAHTW